MDGLLLLSFRINSPILDDLRNSLLTSITGVKAVIGTYEVLGRPKPSYEGSVSGVRLRSCSSNTAVPGYSRSVVSLPHDPQRA